MSVVGNDGQHWSDLALNKRLTLALCIVIIPVGDRRGGWVR